MSIRLDWPQLQSLVKDLFDNLKISKNEWKLARIERNRKLTAEVPRYILSIACVLRAQRRNSRSSSIRKVERERNKWKENSCFQNNLQRTLWWIPIRDVTTYPWLICPSNDLTPPIFTFLLLILRWSCTFFLFNSFKRDSMMLSHTQFHTTSCDLRNKRRCRFFHIWIRLRHVDCLLCWWLLIMANIITTEIFIRTIHGSSPSLRMRLFYSLIWANVMVTHIRCDTQRRLNVESWTKKNN